MERRWDSNRALAFKKGAYEINYSAWFLSFDTVGTADDVEYDTASRLRKSHERKQGSGRTLQ